MRTNGFAARQAGLGALLGSVCLVLAQPADHKVAQVKSGDAQALIELFETAGIPTSLPLIVALVSALAGGCLMTHAAAHQRGVAALVAALTLIFAGTSMICRVLLGS